VRVGSDAVQSISDIFYNRKGFLLIIKERFEFRSYELMQKAGQSTGIVKHKIILTFNKLRTAYEIMTKCESGEYFKNPLGASSSRTSVAHAVADEWHRVKKWPTSTADRSIAF
jgi:hypothetical protein